VESIVIALLVAAIVWVLLRQARARSAAARAAAQPAMPRVGEPGTVSREQLERLKSLGFEPSALWSREEAQLILDAVAYLREVIRAVRGPAEPPVELQNRLLVFILGDAELRERVGAWAGQGPVPRDPHFERVARMIP
jgi:hypothetical protein